ncbi:MAG: hypothetical protein A2W03_08545 [Candidatus Aminicenantes bacterium RBG_16_63_16]|nr:MAG: hypothetical protein A2W03_08545 [Candidatus Aminicenantes bacterium RBG_16_63_16]
MNDSYNRRQFLHRLAALGGAVAIGKSAPARTPNASPAGPLPKRILGRTGANLPVLGLGLGPLGIADFPTEELQAVVEAAIADWGGPVLVDVQWDYGDAEARLAPLLKKRRGDIFLVMKTGKQEKTQVVASVEESLGRLGVERADSLLLNNIGLFDMDRLFRPDGALAGLQEARRRGLAGHLGMSGHMVTRAFVRTLESGEFDLAMFVVNFVDRHTYNFEEKVIPVARQHNAGVVAMKVLGGSASGYESRDQRSMMVDSDIEPAILYVLGVPGVSTAVIGCRSVEQVRLAGAAARRYRPMSGSQEQALMKRGRQLAREWGQHLGEL